MRISSPGGFIQLFVTFSNSFIGIEYVNSCFWTGMKIISKTFVDR